MSATSRLGWVVVMCGGCSLHSLTYLEKETGSGNVGGANEGGAAGSAGAGGAGGSSSGVAGGDDISGAAGAPARCDDLQIDGDKTDVDCGGLQCTACADGRQCIKGRDCLSSICTNQTCQAPTCSDLARNGHETDLNCGGSCPPCSIGHGCLVNADCANSKCLNSVCVLPNCAGSTPDPGCPLLIDNTAYVLHPADTLGSCIDDLLFSANDGNDAQQYTCSGRINQTYWAIAAANGYFSLRSAFSGKCLQVRGNSMMAGAGIEQSTCTGQDSQLFLPTMAAGGLKLTLSSSALSLDVVGATVPSDGQRLEQSVDDGSLDMRWVAQAATGGAFLTLNALGQAGALLRHTGTVVNAEASTGPDAEWKVVPGLAETACVSFESRDQPGAYLRHADFFLWNDISDGSAGFTEDATFCFRDPLSGTSPFNRSLESFNYPGYYLNANGGRVKIIEFTDTPDFRQLATWVMGQRK